jgi:flagellar biosynthesis/type III secretory pathway chaperone
MHLTLASSQPQPGIETASEAESVLQQIADTVERLHLIVQRETELMRASKLVEAAGLEQEKRVLAGEYQRHIELVRRHQERIAALAPESVTALRARHESFQTDLEVNMAVLGTARAVAEDIMRTVASRVGQQHQGPATYGASGAANTKVKATPLSVSRSL